MPVISVEASLEELTLAAAAKEALSLPDSEFHGAVYGRAELPPLETSPLTGLATFLRSSIFVGEIRKASGVLDLVPGSCVVARRRVRKYPTIKLVAYRRDGRCAFFSCHVPISGVATLTSSGSKNPISLVLGTAYAVPVGELFNSSFDVRETLYSLDVTLWGKAPEKPKGARPTAIMMNLGM